MKSDSCRATRSPHLLDHTLGLCYFLTDTSGIGGRLRENIEDFVVEESPRMFPLCKDGDYVHFTLEKKNWETIAAVRSIARSLGVSYKRFGYAGSKDKRSITRQRVAVWRVKPERLMKVNLEGIRLSDFTRSDSRLCIGDLEGNRFRIAVRDSNLPGEELEEVLERTSGQIALTRIPNYYGYQRFGTIRPNTHLVGRRLVEGDIEGAVVSYLGNPYETEKKDAQQARLHFDETKDYRTALRLYPRRLTYERSMLDALAKNPRDYTGAIRRLPKKLRRLLVQAYQAYLFNRTLSAAIERGIDIRNSVFPLIGFRSELDDSQECEVVKMILDEEGVTRRDFLVRHIPELSSEGDVRRGSVEVNPNYAIQTERLEGSRSVVTFTFTLPPGAYATTLLREFMKCNPLAY